MALNTRRACKGPMAAEQELLEQRLKSVEYFMAHMGGLVETLVQNQSQPLFLTDEEQADVLRTWQ